MAEQQVQGKFYKTALVKVQGPVVGQALRTRPQHVRAALPPAHTMICVN